MFPMNFKRRRHVGIVERNLDQPYLPNGQPGLLPHDVIVAVFDEPRKDKPWVLHEQGEALHAHEFSIRMASTSLSFMSLQLNMDLFGLWTLHP